MNRILLIVFITLLPINLQASLTFTQANEAYQKKDFTQAIKLYKESLTHSQSLEQHFNLANAYYETQDYGNAILHYKKAFIFNPHNSDILKNLDLVNNALKIDTSKISIFQSLANLLTANNWSRLFISSIILGLFLFATSLFILPNNFMVKILLSICILLITTCTVLHFFYSHALTSGIVLINEAPLRVSPTSTSPTTALLPVGSEIHIIHAKHPAIDWPFIKTLNNQEGWMNSEDFGFIWK